MTFSRGYVNNGTKELSFITDFGVAYYQANHTLMGMSTDSATDDRQRVWNSSASPFVTIDASTQASWALAATCVVKSFDASSILTLAP